MADEGKGLLSPIKQQIRGLAGPAGKMALRAVRRKVEETTRRLTGFAEGDGFRTTGRLAGAEGGTGRLKATRARPATGRAPGAGASAPGRPGASRGA
ncbi:hypothetical protein [Sphaerisporangium sp. NPDC051011]|uniref:hypothetical protein n=1 Tax=Sphaerisporangium sp. NPDC051011 TaxID=3155792 RepID=UPI0033F265B1